MNVERSVRLLAGTMLLISILLVVFVSPKWLYLTGFVAFNLIQSSITKFCPAEIILKKLFFSKTV